MLDFDQCDLVLSGETLDDFNVVGFVAVLGENNPFGFQFLVFSFDGFADLVNAFG